MTHDRFVDVLAERIRSGTRRPTVDAELAGAAERAPREAAVLLRALAETENVFVDLGSRIVREPSLGGLSGALEAAGFEPGNPGWFDASSSVQLGTSDGVEFGFHWNDNEVEVVEIEPENARLRRFPSFEAWLKSLEDAEVGT